MPWLAFSLSLCLSPSLCLSLSLRLFPSLCLSLSVSLSLRLSLSVSLNVSVCLSLCVFIYMFEVVSVSSVSPSLSLLYNVDEYFQFGVYGHCRLRWLPVYDSRFRLLRFSGILVFVRVLKIKQGAANGENQRQWAQTRAGLKVQWSVSVFYRIVSILSIILSLFYIMYCLLPTMYHVPCIYRYILDICTYIYFYISNVSHGYL